MRHLRFLTLTAALAVTPVAQVAQAQPAGTVQDIQIRGTTDLLAGLVRVNLPVQVGDAISRVNLTAVQLAVLNQGFFQRATAEFQDVQGKTILVVTVVPNLDIKSVVIKSSAIPADRIKTALEQNLNITAGTTLNAARVEQSKELLSRAYRDAGFPFAPRIITDIVEEKDGATITYTVEESVPVSSVEFVGATAVPQDELRAAFKPLLDSGRFDAQTFARGVQAVGLAYDQRGFAQSGVDIGRTELAGGKLSVQVRELKIASIDTAPLGRTVQLKTKAGDLFNTRTLGDELRLIGNALGQTVELGFSQNSSNPSTVNVSFTLSPIPAGKISRVEIKGSGLLSPEELIALLRLRTGDQYNQTLAQDDYLAVRRAYNARGYDLSTQPDPISFSDGVLTYTLREVKIAGYELRWKGDHVTQDRIVLRELPEPGALFNQDALRKGFESVIRTGLVQVSAPQVRPSPQDPNSLIVTFEVQEVSSVNLYPSITYSTAEGWAGQLAFENKNLFGLAHQVSVQAAAGQNDAGQIWTGSLSYTIPWLDIDFLDFSTVKTRVSASLYSNVQGNNKLYAEDGTTQVTSGATAEKPAGTGREYSQRSSGLDFSVSRPLGDFLSVGGYASYSLEQNFLENATEGELSLNFPTRTVQSFVPADGQTVLFSSGLNWDNTNNPEFPSSGIRADGNLGFGFGNAGATQYGWTRATAGASTYLGFGDVLSNGSNQQVLALRANAGTLIGSAPTSRQFSVGGSDISVSPAYQIKGFDNREFVGTNFFTTSAEYRFNFGVNAGIAQGLYGVAFADLGSAWTNGDPQLKAGAGAGIQLNLGLGGFVLPALRFDYAFSEKYTSGKFYFRIGNFF